MPEAEARNHCHGQISMVEQALSYAQSGVSLSVAYGLAGTAQAIDQNLYQFTLDAIRLAYQSPSAARQQIAYGTMVRACVKRVAS